MTVINACGFGLSNTKPISNTNYNAISVASSQTGAANATMFAISDLVSGFDSDFVGINSGIGLFQFIPSMWADMMQQYGYLYNVPDLQSSQTDPLYNSYMGGQFILDIIELLQQTCAIPIPTVGQIYIIFFMGTQGGPKLILSSQTDPSALAANQFPAIASKNKSIFFNNGVAKTNLEVYNFLKAFGDNKGIAYANQTNLIAPCLRGQGVSGYDTTIPNTPGKVLSLQGAKKYIGKWFGGNTPQESSELVKAINGLPNISKWFVGAGNIVNNPPPIGTGVATFGLDGTYGKISETSHSGIYLGPSSDGRGMKILDQYGISVDNPKGLRTDVRVIFGDASLGFINYAFNYRVINIVQ